MNDKFSYRNVFEIMYLLLLTQYTIHNCCIWHFIWKLFHILYYWEHLLKIFWNLIILHRNPHQIHTYKSCIFTVNDKFIMYSAVVRFLTSTTTTTSKNKSYCWLKWAKFSIDLDYSESIFNSFYLTMSWDSCHAHFFN